MRDECISGVVDSVVDTLNSLLFMSKEELREVASRLEELKWDQEVRRYEKGMFLAGVATAIEDAFLDQQKEN